MLRLAPQTAPVPPDPEISALPACLAACCLAFALAAFAALRARERRLASGEAGLSDIAAWTGITDRRGLLAVAGVRERPDGTVCFDPRFLGELPTHPLRRALDGYVGNGLCVAVSLAALGSAASCGEPAAGPPALLAAAAGYLLLGRLWAVAVWLELRTGT
jgi:hypothetical protein